MKNEKINSKTAVYPGSFDPLTNGHLDIIKKASAIFPKLIVAITKNMNKNHSFTLEERVSMSKEAVKNLKNVEVVSFNGLLIDYLAGINVCIMIRGLRAVSDFEYEFQLALMNKKLNPGIETVFLMPEQANTFLSSSMVKEVASLGGKTGSFVPPCVEKYLKKLKV
ncbi:MAG: pantetheine-phosphate adenylyltransferase [Elusimicrobiota bacterium]|jgi:pantetheine-phosphate adenylyltransferase|nr:pantetheine-phosphate adenylyltransferase [Elusimicrobiota bacterium]